MKDSWQKFTHWAPQENTMFVLHPLRPVVHLAVIELGMPLLVESVTVTPRMVDVFHFSKRSIRMCVHLIVNTV